ncbi:hypothetical protein CFC21_099937 [Triticum aestivum]|uniref:Uncharacterized protein n=2 Tax=Triticum aestivum TaxID=4565 RepID=A0A9R1M015_WHEAT|nr:hypothetical protein CFC21_099937 [Triticum aestivum]
MGAITCTLLTAWNLSKGHPHFDEPPAYPYLHIRNKEFPWRAMGLTSAKGIALTVSLFWPPRVSARCHLSVILYESCMLIHYCASSMVCEFLLLLQALIQYVMFRELCI